MATDYGLDLSCTYVTRQALEMPDGSFRYFTGVDIPIDMAEVVGRACLSEALIRRLDTSKGQLIDVVTPPTPQVANYGTDLTAFVNSDFTPREIAIVGASVDAELMQDERVVQSSTVPTLSGALLLIPITITDGSGPFPLVLSISSVSVQVLSVPS